MKKKFNVLVTETYSKWYEVEADSQEQAEELAENEAKDDMELATPEFFDYRTMKAEPASDLTEEDS